MSEDPQDTRTMRLSVSNSVALVIYNTVLVCIFGYGILEKEWNHANWFTYLGLSFVFTVFLGGTTRWETEKLDL